MTREEALKILKSWDGYMFLEREEGQVGYSYKKDVSQEAINVAIKTLEERPQGEWIEDLSNYDNHYPKHIQDIFRCSICGFRNNRQTNFCSECGADMRGKEE